MFPYQLSSVYGILSTGSALCQTLAVVILEKDVRISVIFSILASPSFLLISCSDLHIRTPSVVWWVLLEWLPVVRTACVHPLVSSSPQEHGLGLVTNITEQNMAEAMGCHLSLLRVG